MLQIQQDRVGNNISVGDILFYTERPYSNYADSLVHVYRDGERVRVETLVVNVNDRYIPHQRDEHNDLDLACYARDLLGDEGAVCKELTLLPGVTVAMATVAYAEERFPLQLETLGEAV